MSKAKSTKKATEGTQEIPEGFKLLQEGQAKVLYHVKTSDQDQPMHTEAEEEVKVNKQKQGKMSKEDKDENRDTVFYNPVQEFNRDLSILCITQFGAELQKEREQSKEGWSGLKVLEALAATGLRSVRYMKEVGVDIKKILSNDWDPEAAKLITRNFEYNGIPLEKTQVTAMDALDLMYERRKERDFYDVIDLDPYGTAVPFLDSCIQAIEDGGMMCVTFTDTAVLCAAKPHACYYKYGSVTTHKKNCHEFALRLVLHTICTTANRYQKQIIPMLSLTADFYLRLFIKVVRKPILCHDTILNNGYVFQCNGCQAYKIHNVGKTSGKKKKADEQLKENKEKMVSKDKQSEKDHQHNTKYAVNNFSFPEKCEICDSSFIIGGPIWTEQIHDPDFIDGLIERVEDWKHLGTYKRIKTTLTAIKQETSIGNFPLSMDYDRLISEIKAESISKKSIFSAFKSINYDLVQTYYKPCLYKTNAPHSVVYDVFKAWKKKCAEIKGNDITDKCSGVALKILSKPISVEPDFEFEAEKIKSQLKKNKVGYNNNPPNWGPGSKATSNQKKSEKKAKDKAVEDGADQ